MTESASLWTLFVSSFLAATVLPGGSEVVLFGVLKLHPGQLWAALAVATLGNTLGGMSSYGIGRLIPQQKTMKGLAAVQRYGASILLLSWVPIVGDPLCQPWANIPQVKVLLKLHGHEHQVAHSSGRSTEQFFQELQRKLLDHRNFRCISLRQTLLQACS